MSGTNTGFEGFTAAHFDLYEEAKWSSGKHNLERLRARERVEGLVRAIASDLGGDLAVSSSQDHPTILNDKKVDAQWVVLGRNRDERARIAALETREREAIGHAEDPRPQRREAVLGVRVDVAGVTAGLWVHRHAALDRHNLAKALANGDAPALPDEVSVSPSEAMASGPADAEWLSIERTWARDDEAVSGAEIATRIGETLNGLLPVYRALAWAADNDRVGGETFLAEAADKAPPPVAEAEEPVAAPEPAPEPAEIPKPEPSTPKPKRPSTRGGWTYRPEWAGEVGPKAGDSAGASSQTNSARVRQRAQEVSEAARTWSYAGPVRETPPMPEAPPRPDRNPRDDRGPRRDDRGPGRDDRGPRRDDRGPGRGPKGPIVSGPTVVTSWKDAEGTVSTGEFVRVQGGLFSGKVGKVVEETKKGFKVAVGDLVIEVKSSDATRVVEG